MKIAITSSGNKIATTFDFVDEIVLFDCNNKKIINEKRIVFMKQYIPWRAKILKELKVDIIICGAISNWSKIMLHHHGIKIISGITGDMEIVIKEFLNGNTHLDRYRMPGCSVSRCNKKRSQRRRRVGTHKKMT